MPSGAAISYGPRRVPVTSDMNDVRADSSLCALARVAAYAILGDTGPGGNSAVGVNGQTTGACGAPRESRLYDASANSGNRVRVCLFSCPYEWPLTPRTVSVE